MTRRSVALGILLTSAVAFGSAAIAQTPGDPKVLKVVPTQDMVVLDPITASNPQASSYGFMIYDTLFSLDENYAPQPQMVENYTVSDNKIEYTFVLRDGLKWHDGQPVTAEDCVASIKRWGAKDGMGRILLARTKNIEVVDAKTFRLTLKEPFGLVLDALARANNAGAFMMPKRFADTDPLTPVPEAIGSGPYKLARSEWVPGAKIVFTKNADYVPRKEPPSGLAGGKIPYFDRVEWIIMRDPTTALSALQRGEVDIWEAPPPEMMKIVKADPELGSSVVNPLGRMMHLRPNHTQPPFNDVRAREALQYLTNQNDYMLAAVGDPDGFILCTAMFYCGGPLETSIGSERLAHNDKKKATELFKATGWDFSKPITILQPTDAPEYTATAQVLAQSLRSIGLNPRLVAMDLATMQKTSTTAKGPPEEGGYNIFPSYNSPGNGISPLTSNISLANCEKAWAGWPCNAELEKLRLSMTTASTLEERRKIASDFQKLAYDFGLYVPVGLVKMTVARRADIEGILPTGDVNVYYNVRRKSS